MSQSKDTFIELTNKKIEMNNNFIQAMKLISTILPKYNNKTINKRFIDAVNNLLSENNISVRISFDTLYNGSRNKRFTISYTNRDMKSGGYLDYNSTLNTLYPGTNPEYLSDDFKLNSENLLHVFNVEISRLTENNEDYHQGINQVDDVISIYKHVEKYIQTQMNKIPKCLKDHKYKYLNCPIY